MKDWVIKRNNMISLTGLMGDGFKLGKMDVKYGQVVSNPYVRAFVKEGEDVKTKEGGDHEVFMAQSTLDSIIKAATELKGKIGEQEMDIPAWIQDHITNSENYISQANSGFYKNESTGCAECDNSIEEASVPKMYVAYLGLQKKVRELEDKQKELLQPYLAAKKSNNVTGMNKAVEMLKKNQKSLDMYRRNLATVERDYITSLDKDTEYTG